MEQDTKRILVVDDEVDILTLLAHVLRGASLLVDLAADPIEACEKLETTHYSVILLDLLMPNGGGQRVLDKLASIRPAPSTVVLVLTGATDQAVSQLDPQRIHGVIRKPFDPAELADLVRSCAEIRGGKSITAMCVTTMLAGTPLLAAWLSSKY